MIEMPSVLNAIPELHDTEPWFPVCFGMTCRIQKVEQGFSEKLKTRLKTFMPRKCLAQLSPRRSIPERVGEPIPQKEEVDNPSLFCSAGSTGVVDLGASQTVIGSDQVPELLESIPDVVRKQVRRRAVDLTFRFGNHQTLKNSVALFFPLQGSWFRVAVVPGPTPFLLSKTFLKQIKAVIDADAGTVWSKELKKFLDCTVSQKELIMMNINSLWQDRQQDTHHCDTLPETTLQVQHIETKPVSSDPDTATPEQKGEQTEAEIVDQCENPSMVQKLIAHFEHADTKYRPDENHRPIKYSPGKPSDQKVLNQTPELSAHTQSHVVDQSLAPVPGSTYGSRSDRCAENDARAAQDVSDRFRRCKEGCSVPGSLCRSEVDAFHRESVREKCQDRTCRS